MNLTNVPWWLALAIVLIIIFALNALHVVNIHLQFGF